ncbi:hypothetical protein BFJ72_g10792 [Fusarium proliferatum]|uniref:Uncharacterized protein n=1 Tax=Gibberella intermedia TaxID=948311 RepID=A0A420SSK3_GIBIN|nr:hypothetical protein BFJ72_g10792 [Fusarium proliferatum]
MFDQAVLVVLALGYLGDRKRGKIQVPKELSPCHLAALFGLIDLAKSQMERPNLDAIDDCGSADLVWAMECLTFEFSFDVEIDMHCRCSALYPDIDLDRRHVVKALIASGANPHMLGYEGNTPLHLAAISGDEDIIKMLLDRGADISTSNEYGHIPLVLAVRYRRETAYMKLLELGTVDMCGENHRTALIEAASVGDLTLVKTLVQRGATVDFLDETGQTALMEASRGRNPQIVKLLLEKKSDVNLKDHNCDTAIIKACIGGDPSVIELLLEANAQLEFTNAARETVLSNVGRSCGEGIIKRLLRHSTDPATRDRHSGYVLASASKNGRLDIVSSILEDAAFKPALEHLNLALSNSCSAGNEKVVKLLIDHGASPNTNLELMEWPETLLTRAIREGDDAIVLLLLDAGINCENENKAEIGPIHAAASTGTKLMVQSLIDKGFSVNHRASIGRMPLDFAMRREDKDTSIADFLRERGAITEVERLVRFMRNRRKKVD